MTAKSVSTSIREIVTFKNCWWRYKRLNTMEGNLATSSKIIYTFALYPGNLLLGIFLKIHQQNYTKMYTQNDPL